MKVVRQKYLADIGRDDLEDGDKHKLKDITLAVYKNWVGVNVVYNMYRQYTQLIHNTYRHITISPYVLYVLYHLQSNMFYDQHDCHNTINNNNLFRNQTIQFHKMTNQLMNPKSSLPPSLPPFVWSVILSCNGYIIFGVMLGGHYKSHV